MLLSIENLQLSVRDHQILRNVSVDVAEGETVGLVGESGSGKSTTARAALRLVPDGARMSGSVRVCGNDVTDPAVVRRVRRTMAAMIFQEPRSVLNPVRRIGDSATERLVHVHGMTRAEARTRIAELFVEVGLKDTERLSRCHPHQLSGGMLQRVVIAAALSIAPRLLLADEATSALDVTTQAEVLALLRRLQREREMGVLFITHDLHLAAAYCDRVYVMKDGSIVDSQKGGTILANPVDPYTKALAEAVPLLPERDPSEARR
ncbi:ABC transporter ATP-binding protein [Plantactinospora sp. CA-294935]|uniref:ABC transporter ATP-binding protein n=1 Tax=Plantactinospora sp. CA-294935 TaxID=3240012 RepID=UPI003D904752